MCGHAEASRNGRDGALDTGGAGGTLTGGGREGFGLAGVGPGFEEDSGQKEGGLEGEENKESTK